MSVTFSKGEEARKRVLDSALALFFEQGYDKTTMRQIVQKSGVLNGSVYHAFRNKDAIFELVLNDVMDKVFGALRPMDEDILTYTMLPLAYELKFAHDRGITGDLIYHANRSWTVFSNLVDRMTEYVMAYAEQKGWPFSKERVHRGAVTVLGATRGLVDEYTCCDSEHSLEDGIRQITVFCAAMFLVPIADTEEVLKKVMDMISDDGQRFAKIDFGYSPSE